MARLKTATRTIRVDNETAIDASVSLAGFLTIRTASASNYRHGLKAPTKDLRRSISGLAHNRGDSYMNWMNSELRRGGAGNCVAILSPVCAGLLCTIGAATARA